MGDLEPNFFRKGNEEEENERFVCGLWVSRGDGSGTLTTSMARSAPTRGVGKFAPRGKGTAEEWKESLIEHGLLGFVAEESPGCWKFGDVVCGRCGK